MSDKPYNYLNPQQQIEAAEIIASRRLRSGKRTKHNSTVELDYHIVHIASINDFTTEVKRRISEGWRLHGDTFIDVTGFYQPMIMEE